jgi:alpha-galactosidase
MTHPRQYLRLALFLAIIITMLMAMLFGQASVMPLPRAEALDNGLARTPPMGWNSWNRFGCNVTDAMVRQMADAMVSSGMRDAGYQYINVDDCWQGTGRTNGHVNLDPDFPNMKALADYVHSRGLKFGLYSDRGTNTCAGRVGSYGYETTDANDYAAWGVDYLKYDNCYAVGDMQTAYVHMRDALAASGRPIVFSICAWQYQSWMPATGNLWRTTGDIYDGWSSVWGIPNTNNASASVAGPGAWSDPDMLEVGNGGMTDTEYRTHMGWWAIMAAPLIAGNDLRTMSQATKDILMAPEIVAVDQDPLGVQGTRVWDDGNSLNIWSKRISGTNTRAVFLLNGRSSAANITVNWSQIGLPSGNATVRDLWTRTDLGTFNNSFTATNIPSHGSRMLKIVSTSSSGGGPEGYTWCANENGTCTFSGTASVAYGANGVFNYRTATNSIACNNATFGDPLSGVVKACYYQTSSCTPTAITPYVQINNGAWTQTSSASVNVGDSVRFGPQPASGGSWSWSGPNGFSSTAREATISNIQANQAGNYVATYTNTGGCTSTQTFSVIVSGGDLLTNGNAESGTSSWGVFGAGTLAANTSVVHGGSQSLLLTGRTGSWNGISQNVTSRLTSGRSYTTNVWVRTQSGAPTAKVTLAVTANGSTSYISLAQGAVNSSGWTLLSGTATVSWTGTLTSATFYVETAAGTDSFYIDDASFR